MEILQLHKGIEAFDRDGGTPEKPAFDNVICDPEWTQLGAIVQRDEDGTAIEVMYNNIANRVYGPGTEEKARGLMQRNDAVNFTGIDLS